SHDKNITDSKNDSSQYNVHTTSSFSVIGCFFLQIYAAEHKIFSVYFSVWTNMIMIHGQSFRGRLKQRAETTICCPVVWMDYYSRIVAADKYHSRTFTSIDRVE